MNSFKPQHYNSLSPYIISDNADELAEFLRAVFAATVLRRYEREDGKVLHMEMKLDDSVIMISDSTKEYAANKTMLHFYVPDVMHTFNLAIEKGAELIDRPKKSANDPDMRGSFYDCSGNYWSVSTQQESE